MTPSKFFKAHCNRCGGERNHEVLYVEKQDWDDDSGVSGGDKYQMLKCGGCESVKLRHASWCSEDIGENGLPAPTVRYYPPAIFRAEPAWMTDLWLELSIDDDRVHDLLKEIYIALQNNSPRLAAMGTRALLEQIMVSKVGDHGTFSANLEEFEKKGFVSSMQKERLKTILEAGHAAIHRGFKPSSADLITLVDIAEFLIQHIYLHGSKVDELKKKIPSRKKPTGS